LYAELEDLLEPIKLIALTLLLDIISLQPQLVQPQVVPTITIVQASRPQESAVLLGFIVDIDTTSLLCKSNHFFNHFYSVPANYYPYSYYTRACSSYYPYYYSYAQETGNSIPLNSFTFFKVVLLTQILVAICIRIITFLSDKELLLDITHLLIDCTQ
jgi:hypothetical protein